MGLKFTLVSTLIGILCLKGVGCTCSTLWPSLEQTKVATMCKSSVVEGTDVYIDTDLGGSTTLNRGTACTCDVQTQRGNELKIWSRYDGIRGTKCGTSIDFTGEAFGSQTMLSTPCFSYMFDVETHTYPNITVGFRKEALSFTSSYTSPYCVRLTLIANTTDSGNTGGEVSPLIRVTCAESNFLPPTTTTTTPSTTTTHTTTTATQSSTTPSTTTTISTKPTTTKPPTTSTKRTTTTTKPPITSTKRTTTTTKPTTTSTNRTTSTTKPPTTLPTTKTTTTTPIKTTTTKPTTSTSTRRFSITSTTRTSTTNAATTTTKPTTTTTKRTTTTPRTTTTTAATTIATTTPATTTTHTPPKISSTTTQPATTTTTTRPTTTEADTTTSTKKLTTATEAVTTTSTKKVTTATEADTTTSTKKLTTATEADTTTTTKQPTTTTEAVTTTTKKQPTTTKTTTQRTTTQSTTPKPRCDVGTQFECGNGSCIALSWRCDGLDDCSDKSDETGCSTYVCGQDRFLCNERKTCIRLSERCDGKYQCPDMSDETDCGSPTTAPATSSDDVDRTAIIIGCIAGGLLLIATLGCIIYWTRTKNWNRRTDRYSMKSDSEKTLTPDLGYSPPPTLHSVLPPAEKHIPTHVWYPSTDRYGDIPDVYDAEHTEASTGDKRYILL